MCVALQAAELARVKAGEAVTGLRSAAKIFGGAAALKDASFDLRSGGVLALLGENGAGKSTCVQLLAGVHRPTSGHVELSGAAANLA